MCIEVNVHHLIGVEPVLLLQHVLHHVWVARAGPGDGQVVVHLPHHLGAVAQRQEELFCGLGRVALLGVHRVGEVSSNFVTWGVDTVCRVLPQWFLLENVHLAVPGVPHRMERGVGPPEQLHQDEPQGQPVSHDHHRLDRFEAGPHVQPPDRAVPPRGRPVIHVQTALPGRKPVPEPPHFCLLLTELGELRGILQVTKLLFTDTGIDRAVDYLISNGLAQMSSRLQCALEWRDEQPHFFIPNDFFDALPCCDGLLHAFLGQVNRVVGLLLVDLSARVCIPLGLSMPD
mmetsp:Transcript_47582/g.85029  ORF Transcript_47582/g.85029 Transcript_47582/m.85029 type:complete len:287 (-) Transcript_47582:168-1028(-)